MELYAKPIQIPPVSQVQAKPAIDANTDTLWMPRCAQLIFLIVSI
jgi:hypothetical protein